jgi:hypothetical protein
MKKRLVVALMLAMFAMAVFSSCKGQDCPAYNDFKGKPSASISY